MIRQFSVHTNPGPGSAEDAPFMCVLQSHYLEAVDTVVVAPMLKGRVASTPSQVAVPVVFDGTDYLLDVSLLANVDRGDLRRPAGSLLSYEDDIRRALDRLFTGF